MTAIQFVIYMLTILLSPLIAVQVTQWLQRKQEVKDRRERLFKSIMSTRASRLSREHVMALNMIDVEYYGSDAGSKAVRSAWKAYLDHLNTWASGESWLERQEQLLTDLLFVMAKSLGYELDKTDIRRTSYFPKGHGDLEDDNFKLRKGLVAVIEGRSPILVTPVDVRQARGEAGSTGDHDS